MFTVATIDVQGNDKVIVVIHNNEVNLTEEEIGNHFQETSSKGE